VILLLIASGFVGAYMVVRCSRCPIRRKPVRLHRLEHPHLCRSEFPAKPCLEASLVSTTDSPAHQRHRRATAG